MHIQITPIIGRLCSCKIFTMMRYNEGIIYNMFTLTQSTFIHNMFTLFPGSWPTVCSWVFATIQTLEGSPWVSRCSLYLSFGLVAAFLLFLKWSLKASRCCIYHFSEIYVMMCNYRPLFNLQQCNSGLKASISASHCKLKLKLPNRKVEPAGCEVSELN